MREVSLWQKDPTREQCAAGVTEKSRYEEDEYGPRGSAGVRRCEATAELGALFCTRHLALLVSAPLRARAVLMWAAGTAAEKLVHLMENAEKEEVQLRAAESVLNRTGVSEKQTVTFEAGKGTGFERMLETLFNVEEEGGAGG